MKTYWKEKEDRLAGIRDNLVKRGATAQEAIADTATEQERNNRRFDTMRKKYSPGFLV